MVTLYVFLLLVGAVGALAYVALFFTHVPGAIDERLGKLEALPDDLNHWVSGKSQSADGLLRETRSLLLDSSSVSADKLIVQVRYRDPRTNEIVRVDPETVKKRRRVKN